MPAGVAHGAPPDVAAADDHRDVDAQLPASGRDLLGDALHDRGVDAEVGLGIGERLTRELQHDAPETALAHAGALHSVDGAGIPIVGSGMSGSVPERESGN